MRTKLLLHVGVSMLLLPGINLPLLLPKLDTRFVLSIDVSTLSNSFKKSFGKLERFLARDTDNQPWRLISAPIRSSECSSSWSTSSSTTDLA